MEDTVTHKAGLPVEVNGRILQRCAICGEKLLDSQGVMVVAGEDGSVPPFGTWRCGAFIQIKPGNPTRFTITPPEEMHSLPDDLCIELVE